MPIKNIKHGKNFNFIEPVNLYDCEFNNDVFIGPFVEVQSNVNVGSNTRIQSHTFICSEVEIGNNCFIGHGVMFVNDKFRNQKLNPNTLFEKTVIGNNVLIGSNSTILPVTIVDDVVIGAGSVVTKDISEPGVYFGNPAIKKVS